jgi:class 3 adenylate cyclase
MYIQEHDNVSILYADVVNYTMISTTLSPMKMVELLNELFGRFDEASEVSCICILFISVCITFRRPIGAMIRILAYCARGRGFDSRTVQIFVCMNMSVCIGSGRFL